VRSLVDESTGPAVARWLREQHHDVVSVFDEARGISDDEVIRRAYVENRILITNDKDFGAQVYRERFRHRGVVSLRLENERVQNKIAVIRRLLDAYSDLLKTRKADYRSFPTLHYPSRLSPQGHHHTNSCC
jgi:predicted nuclease of predicted toxin-antitoxin system